ncbi:sigma-70 family RNA polymerase sigma factor [Hydrogenivirga sp. 128-5-R1-1]|uniref:sigma-70 family RNA polymerase sigma factor n=1 Tax=Hydrogenivirga sp. 128-5-R1-1 TaxID=392423 RepID=UPI00015F0CEF|nr:sigma-70 family RNA polymerase sigma factor [Hydrogenivirga sp. 128-5-R1-1]EDP75984.1 hypothetical protein HG1285_06645 [Hydrogenivirga sp. 128-5-R1-1]
MKDILIALAQGKEDLKARNFLIKEIRAVARESNTESLLRNRIGDDYAEEILADFKLKVLLMLKSGKLEEKEFISTFYVRKMIRSCIVDALNGDPKLNLVNMEELNYQDEEGNVVSFEENVGIEEDKDLSITVGDLFSELVNKLSEKDKKVMCYYLYKSLYAKEIALDGLSKANLYKSWERLKKKLAEEMPYVPSEEEFREFAERFLSEVCDKEGYSIERKDSDGE